MKPGWVRFKVCFSKVCFSKFAFQSFAFQSLLLQSQDQLLAQPPPHRHVSSLSDARVTSDRPARAAPSGTRTAPYADSAGVGSCAGAGTESVPLV